MSSVPSQWSNNVYHALPPVLNDYYVLTDRLNVYNALAHVPNRLLHPQHLEETWKGQTHYSLGGQP